MEAAPANENGAAIEVENGPSADAKAERPTESAEKNITPALDGDHDLAQTAQPL